MRNMKWFNVETAILHSPELIGSDPTARATWLCISLWCATQENSGRIVGAKQWKDRQWQQTCGVTIEEVNHETHLLKWDGEDLLVWNYPIGKQDEVASKRKAGEMTAHLRWDNSANSSAIAGATCSATTEWNGKEGKGKEEEASQAHALATDDEFLDALALNPAYSHINIRFEFEKNKLWCEHNRHKPTKRRFLTWINRIERPMVVAPVKAIKYT